MKKTITLITILISFLMGTAFAGEYIYTPGGDPDLSDLDHRWAYTWGMDISQDSQGKALDRNKEQIIGATLYFDNIKNHDTSDNDMFVSVMENPVVGLGSVEDNHLVASDEFSSDPLLFRWEDINDQKRDISITMTNSQFETEVLGLIAGSTYLGDLDGNAYSSGGWYDDPNAVYDETGTVSGDASNPDATLWDGVGDRGDVYVSDSAFADLLFYIQGNVMELGFDPDCHYYNSGVSLVLWTKAKSVSGVPEPGTFILFGIGLIGISAKLRKKIS